VESPDAAESVRALVDYAQGRSPIWNTLAQPVSIEWTFDIDATDAPPDTSDVRHGVNTASLIATVQAVQQMPVLARCRFYTSSEWLGDARVRSASPGFDQAEGSLLLEHRDTQPKGYTGDCVRELLGTDAGVAPEEALLQAMAGCVSVTTSYHAAARGIRLDAFDVEFEGDVDMQGFGDLDDRVTPGYQQIRGRIYIRAGAPEAALREFLDFTTAHSPMCDSVAQPVQLTSSLICNGVQS
jgi:uncharacterized OsmC-like protein